MIQEEYFGPGSIKNLPTVLSKLSSKNIFLVTGNKSFASSGAEKISRDLLSEYNVYRYCEFTENPKLDDISKAMLHLKKTNCDTVIAIGGGSVIDFAKLVNIFANQTEHPAAYLEGKAQIKNKGNPLIAIPTTSGAGSEATHFAVVYNNKEKFSVAHKSILPEVAIIDPELTYNLPAVITATSGIDALCQAIESYWCVNSTDDSKKFSKEAIELVLENLYLSVTKPGISSRVDMAKAANLSGKAINMTKTTAPHALSYSMTSYFGIPHGQAVGVSLGEFLVYNYEVNEEDLVDSRGVMYVKNSIEELVNILGCKDVVDAKLKIKNLMESVKLKTRLSELNIRAENLKTISDNVNLERLKNNPRAINEKSLMSILKNIL